MNAQKSKSFDFLFDEQMTRFVVVMGEMSFYLYPNTNFPFEKRYVVINEIFVTDPEVKFASTSFTSEQEQSQIIDNNFYFSSPLICNIDGKFIEQIFDEIKSHFCNKLN